MGILSCGDPIIGVMSAAGTKVNRKPSVQYHTRTGRI
jgi:hypothetical protein